MPILLPQVLAPYDTVDTVLDFARVIANDMEISTAGDLLADTQPSTLPLLNLAWRGFQDVLTSNGIEVCTRTETLFNMPPNLSLDPADKAWIGFDSYFDGQAYWPTPVLPEYLLEPLRVWQRQTGMQQGFTQLNPSNDGLEDRYPQSWLQDWEWNNDRIYTNGALLPMDLKIRMLAYFPDFALDQQGNFPATAQVPILRSAEPLAYSVVMVFAGGRGSDYYGALASKQEASLQPLLNRTARKKQRGNHRRRPYGWCGTGRSWNGW